MPSLNEMLSDMPMHQNFYIRGVVNSLLPDFMNPLDKDLTEKNISGEAIELLRYAAENLAPDLREGEVFQASSYKINLDKADTLKADNFLDELSNVYDAKQMIALALGNFGITKQNGQYVIFDTYDFNPTFRADKGETPFDAVKDLIGGDVQPMAQEIAQRLMPDTSDDNMRVRIAIPNEPEVIATDYDNDIPENATSFLFEGPMTTKRKSIFDAFISTAQAGTLNDNVDLANLTDLGTERDLRVGDFKPFPMDGNDEEGRMNEAQRALLDGDE